MKGKGYGKGPELGQSKGIKKRKFVPHREFYTTREEIEEATQKFLDEGGKIEILPPEIPDPGSDMLEMFLEGRSFQRKRYGTQ